MKTTEFMTLIHVDEYSATPKYLQLSESIIEAIEDGKLQKDDLLPSINELSCTLEISRDTVEKGYKDLKSKGVVVSVPGKGYYIGQTDFKRKIKIFLLFNKLSAHKKIIFDSFVSALGKDAVIHFYVYNNDFTIFKKLIQNRPTDYSHYVIIPHFVEGGDGAAEIINTLPKEKLILIDKKVAGVYGNYSAIYENFEKDIYSALKQAKNELAKYHTLNLIFPQRSYFPQEIKNGFRLFCQQYAFGYHVVHDIKSELIKRGEVYINLMEDDLVDLIENINLQGLSLGTDVGVISYNETPLKKFLLNGITTISTDFQFMGSMAAEIIKSKCRKDQEAPFNLTLRASL